MVVEGYILVVDDSSYLWMVRGYHHPHGFFIAVPRYTGSGGKVKSLRRAFEVASSTGNVMYLEGLARIVPAVRKSSVKRVLDPWSWSPAGETIIEKTANELVELLSDSGGLEKEAIGVTGSLLAKKVLSGLETRDIDIVVAGTRESRKAYEALRKLRGEGLLKPVTGRFSESEVLDPASRTRLARNRILEGTYKGIPYSIRLLSQRVSREHDICHRLVCSWKGVIKITTPVSPYIMPYIYDITVLKSYPVKPKPSKLYSMRLRLSEIPVGTLLEVSGVLEHDCRENTLYLNMDWPSAYARIVEIG